MSSAKDMCRQALAFLDAQRLPPTPANYQLAFGYHEGKLPGLFSTIKALIDGGVRLTQAQADVLSARFYGGAAAGHAAPSANPSDTIRHHTLRLSDLTASATEVTGDLNRELSARLPGFAAIAELEQMVAGVLAMSRATESKLAATNVELEALREKLEEAQGNAEKDALTGLPNRRGIDAFLAAFVSEGRRGMVAICDVDRFKTYNDRYGHAVGDRVLKTVASSLTSSLDGHFVGRWGGEEFLIVAAVGPEEGVLLIERAKDELGDRHFKLRETDEPLGRITFSAGVVPLVPGGDDVATTLEHADALLYEAKRRGRDRVLDESARVAAAA